MLCSLVGFYWMPHCAPRQELLQPLYTGVVCPVNIEAPSLIIHLKFSSTLSHHVSIMCQALMGRQKKKEVIISSLKEFPMQWKQTFSSLETRRPYWNSIPSSKKTHQLEKRLFMQIDPINCEVEEGCVFGECEVDRGPPSSLP